MKEIRLVFLLITSGFLIILMTRIGQLDPESRSIQYFRRIYASTKITPLARHFLRHVHYIKGSVFRDDFERTVLRPQWTVLSGKVFIENRRMVMTASGGKKSAGILLKDTRYWLDYQMDLELNWPIGKEAGIYLKRQAPDRYVRLMLRREGVFLQVKNGPEEVRTLAAESMDIDTNMLFHFRIRVGAARVEVSLNDRVLFNGPISFDPPLITGSAGFFLWAADGSPHEMSVDNFMIKKGSPKLYAISEKAVKDVRVGDLPWPSFGYLSVPIDVLLVSRPEAGASSVGDKWFAASFYYGVPMIIQFRAHEAEQDRLRSLMLSPEWRNLAGIHLELPGGKENLIQTLDSLKTVLSSLKEGKIVVFEFAEGDDEEVIPVIRRKLKSIGGKLFFLIPGRSENANFQRPLIEVYQ
jgi:hypothetical protein